MAIIKCSECGGQVSSSAKQCPHCGALPKKFNKSSSSLGKVLLWIVAIGIVASIFSPKHEKNAESVAAKPEVESHVVAATSPSPVSTLPATSICKAAIATVMGRPVSTISATDRSGEVALSYIRADDNSKWEYKCKVEGAKIIWAMKGGRWRTHSEDSVVQYSVGPASLTITESYNDGTISSEEFKLSEL